MQLTFSKMHGLGNDFVVIDAINQGVHLNTEQIRHLADRRFGIGCDQVLLVESPRDTATEFYYRIFNADGTEVEQCGNGARCFARFVREQGLTDNNTIDVGTRRGNIRLFIEAEIVRVDMGPPILVPDQIPFLADQQQTTYELEDRTNNYQIAAVSMGNPHAVLQVDSVDTAPVERLGPWLEHHARFPQRVNVGFMEILAPDRIRLRVYERGVGETLACGTGACAAVVAGRLQGLLEQRVQVSLPGGELMIQWDQPDQNVWMSGPAARVFDGRIEL